LHLFFGAAGVPDLLAGKPIGPEFKQPFKSEGSSVIGL
jgi:hypothetical protein